MTGRKQIIIWDGTFCEFEQMAEELKSEMEEIYPNETNDFWIRLAQETHERYLDDERSNLDIKTDQDIVIFAELGLWYGKKLAFKKLSPHNINAIFQPFAIGDIKFYYDGYGNICADEYHHDGTNHYIYRTMKEGLHADDLGERFSDGSVTAKNFKSYMYRYTKSIAAPVKKIYGWK